MPGKFPGNRQPKRFFNFGDCSGADIHRPHIIWNADRTGDGSPQFRAFAIPVGQAGCLIDDQRTELRQCRNPLFSIRKHLSQES